MFNKGKISSALQSKKEVLEEQGYTFSKVSKSGWIWNGLGEHSSGRGSDEAEVVERAWSDACEDAKRILSIPDETWARMGTPEQSQMISEALQSR